jgi:lauroyl/myristoyl acyltransferase
MAVASFRRPGASGRRFSAPSGGEAPWLVGAWNTMLEYFAFRLIVFVLRILPRRWGIAIARWLGGMVYRVSPLAEAGRDNFRHVLGPDADLERVSALTRQAFVGRLINYYEMLWLSGRELQGTGWWSEIYGLENIDRALADGGGAVVAAGHLGPFEYMIQGVVSLGYDMIGIVEHMKNERLYRYMVGLRSAHGLDLISTKGSLLEVYRRVKRGGILLSAVDRDSTETGLIVDFFGAPAWMPDGYARLAVRAGVPVLFGYPWRTGDGAEARVFPPIHADPALGKDEAVRDVVERTVRLLEDAIRERPEEWHLSTPIWQLARDRMGNGASR